MGGDWRGVQRDVVQATNPISPALASSLRQIKKFGTDFSGRQRIRMCQPALLPHLHIANPRVANSSALLEWQVSPQHGVNDRLPPHALLFADLLDTQPTKSVAHAISPPMSSCYFVHRSPGNAH